MSQQRPSPPRKPQPAAGKRPDARTGEPATGRIVKLMFGQGHGFIRLSDQREVYFHRADVQEGTAFNTFEVGDRVDFELLDDQVSGARALQVRRRKGR